MSGTSRPTSISFLIFSWIFAKTWADEFGSGLEPVRDRHVPPMQQHGRGTSQVLIKDQHDMDLNWRESTGEGSSQQINCESLKSFKECSQHSDQCTVIEGEVCAA